MTPSDPLASAAADSRSRSALRLLAALVIATLFSSLLIGTPAWIATWMDDQSLWSRLATWVPTWAAYSVWTCAVSVPSVLLGWAVDRRTARMRPANSRLVFAALGLIVGAAVAVLLLSSLGTVGLAVAIVGTIGAITAYVTRRFLDPLARTPALLAALTLMTTAMVVTGLVVY